jgi:hypothetical protein
MKAVCEGERAWKYFKTEAIGNFQTLECDVENKSDIMRQLTAGSKPQLENIAQVKILYIYGSDIC